MIHLYDAEGVRIADKIFNEVESDAHATALDFFDRFAARISPRDLCFILSQAAGNISAERAIRAGAQRRKREREAVEIGSCAFCGHLRGEHAYPGALGTPCAKYPCKCQHYSAPEAIA